MRDGQILSCPACGSRRVWVEDSGVEYAVGMEAVRLDGASLFCECRDCRAMFRVRATGFETVRDGAPSGGGEP
ncbi:MAG: hypothetical protein WC948_05910 [Thermovirgaceae bacterium]|jgi:hypothetical protein